MKVVHKRTWGGRLFQTVGAAAWKAREPNDKLDHVTDKTLAEAERKALHGLCRWSKLYLPVWSVYGPWYLKQRNEWMNEWMNEQCHTLLANQTRIRQRLGCMFTVWILKCAKNCSQADEIWVMTSSCRLSYQTSTEALWKYRNHMQLIAR